MILGGEDVEGIDLKPADEAQETLDVVREQAMEFCE